MTSNMEVGTSVEAALTEQPRCRTYAPRPISELLRGRLVEISPAGVSEEDVDTVGYSMGVSDTFCG